QESDRQIQPLGRLAAVPRHMKHPRQRHEQRVIVAATERKNATQHMDFGVRTPRADYWAGARSDPPNELLDRHDGLRTLAAAQRVLAQPHEQIAGRELALATIRCSNPAGALLDDVKPREPVLRHAERPIARELQSAEDAAL